MVDRALVIARLFQTRMGKKHWGRMRKISLQLFGVCYFGSPRLTKQVGRAQDIVNLAKSIDSPLPQTEAK
jgi:hypothetical protein